MKRYAKNTSVMYIEHIIRLVVVFAVGIPVTRYLQPENFGILNYAAGWVGLFLSMSTLGLEEIVVRDLVKNPSKRDELIGTSFLLRSIGSALMIIVVTTFSWARGNDATTIQLIFIFAFAEFFRSSTLIEQYYRSRVEARKTVPVHLLQVIISAAIKLVLVFLEADIRWFAAVVIVETLILTIGFFAVYKTDGFLARKWRATWSMAKYLMQQAWPLFIFGFALFVQARIDQVMIRDILTATHGLEFGNREVGQYSVALKMVEAIAFLSVLLQKSLAPAITLAKEKDFLLYEDRLLNQYRLMFILFIITGMPLYMFSEQIIILLYGEEFRPAGILLSLLSLRLLFIYMGVGKTSFITNENLFRYSLATALVGATVNIALNYALIGSFHAKGAVIATIVSFFVSMFIMDALYRKTRWNLKLMTLAMVTFWKVHQAR